MNRWCSLICLGLAVLPGIPRPAEAGVFAYEPFTGSDELVGSNGGVGWGGPWGGVAINTEFTIINLQFAIPGGGTIAGSSNSVLLQNNDFNSGTRSLAEPVDANVVYAAFLLRGNTNAIGTGDQFVLWLDDLSSGTHADAPNLGWIGNRGTGSGAEDGFASLNFGDNEVFSAALSADAAHYLVARLRKSVPGAAEVYDRLDLWLDPACSDRPAPDATVVQAPAATALAAFDTIGLGTSAFDGGDIAFVDELRLATSWLEVMACPALALFADDFESTDTSAWSTTAP
jgi:hypothetical protein